VTLADDNDWLILNSDEDDWLYQHFITDDYNEIDFIDLI